ncbi:hypothetical protein NXX42_00660 [Bacteroides thetaiotaomicron]|nr:hypothetical protein [Bacteroides thetaiotaomicron]
MKKIFNILIIAFIAFSYFSCDDWTETEAKNFEPEPLSEEYYAALRAYKKSDHPIAFGWFGKLGYARRLFLILQFEKCARQRGYYFHLGTLCQFNPVPDR